MLKWNSGTVGELNGVPFRFVTNDFDKHITSDTEIIVLKPKSFFDFYRTTFSGPRSILEFGIFEAGSILILAEMYPDTQIVGVDIRAPRPAALRLIERMGYSNRVSLHYGLSQDDAAAVTHIINEELSGAIDLVIDDASHLYTQTRATFEAVFPYVRPGGRYVIEDWAWAHWPSNAYDEWKGTTLSSLVMELMMASASTRDVVEQVSVNSVAAVVKRGPAKISKPLNISEMYKIAPRTWTPVR